MKINKQNTNRYWMVFLGLWLVVFSSTLSAKNSKKIAFDTGIKGAIKVISHEKNQATEPIPTGYCIALSDGKKQSIDDFFAIKLENLALYMKLKPSLLQITSDEKREKILCFATTEKRLAAHEVLKSIRKKYKRIDTFSPRIVKLDETKHYDRLIPIIGIQQAVVSKAPVLMATTEDEKFKAKAGTQDSFTPTNAYGDSNTSSPRKPIPRCPVIKVSDQTIRYKDTKRGISIQMADRKHPRILRIKKLKS